MNEEVHMNDRMEWQASVPIFRHTVILKQMVLAIGLPFGLVMLVILLTSKGSRDTPYALGLIVALLTLTFLFIMVVYRGRHEAEFVLDGNGVRYRTQARETKTNRLVNGLSIVLGLASGRPTIAGVGMMAQARQETYLPWNRIRKVSYQPRNHTILLRGSPMEPIALFCTPENYEAVERFVASRVRPAAG